ncbi:MAG: ribosome maturation factor RimP [bacterium]|nr:MAG: ribosome maturation factor RimP [bacterium]
MVINAKIEAYEEDISLFLEENGYSLVDYKVVRQKKSTRFKVVIDQQVGVDHKDCSRVSKLIQTFLDDNEFLSDYNIEVSSPGIYRELKSLRELKAFLGRRVLVSYLDNAKLLQETGILKEASQQQILLKTETINELVLPGERIKKIRLVD